MFARCHPLVDPEPFVALCEKTLCTCAQGLRCPCMALLEYARACAQQGMVLYGWTDHTACRKSAPTLPAGHEWCLSCGVTRETLGQCHDPGPLPHPNRPVLQGLQCLGHLVTQGWPAGGVPSLESCSWEDLPMPLFCAMPPPTPPAPDSLGKSVAWT